MPDPSRKGGPGDRVAGLLAALLVLGASFLLLPNRHRMPEDWLLLVTGPEGEWRFDILPPFLESLFDLLGFREGAPSRTLLWFLGFDLLGLCLVGGALLRSGLLEGGWSVILLGSLAFWPWLSPEPAGLTQAPHHLRILLLGLASWLARARRGSAFPGLLLLGFLRVTLVGWEPPLAEILFLVAFARGGRWEEGRMGGVPCVLSFLGGACLALALGLFAKGPAVPSPAFWWLDLQGSSILRTPYLSSFFLALWSLLIWLRRIGGTRWVSLLAVPGWILLLFTLGGSLWTFELYRQRVLHLDRDQGSFARALPVVPRFQETIFVNLPMHVRPYLAHLAGEGQWASLRILRTWDTGKEIHLPEGFQADEKTLTIRWKAGGFVREHFEACLIDEPVPLVLSIRPGGVPFPRDLLSLVRSGSFPEEVSLEGPTLGEGGDVGEWTAFPEGDAVKLEASEAREWTFAVARSSGTWFLFSDPPALKKPLSSGWFGDLDPGSELDRIRIEKKAGLSCEKVGWLLGFGPILRITGTGSLLVR